MPLPAWRENRTAAIAEVDAIEYLARAPQEPEAAGQTLDIGGPDVLSYGEMIERIAEAMGVGRMPVALPASVAKGSPAVLATASSVGSGTPQ